VTTKLKTIRRKYHTPPNKEITKQTNSPYIVYIFAEMDKTFFPQLD